MCTLHQQRHTCARRAGPPSCLCLTACSDGLHAFQHNHCRDHLLFEAYCKADRCRSGGSLLLDAASARRAMMTGSRQCGSPESARRTPSPHSPGCRRAAEGRRAHQASGAVPAAPGFHPTHTAQAASSWPALARLPAAPPIPPNPRPDRLHRQPQAPTPPTGSPPRPSAARASSSRHPPPAPEHAADSGLCQPGLATP